MGEALPVLLGFAAGLSTAGMARHRFRFAVCLAAGVLASAANGELNSSLWPLFVTGDFALVLLGAGVGAAISFAVQAWRLPR